MALEVNKFCYDCMDRLFGYCRGLVGVGMFCSSCYEKRKEKKK